MEETKEEIKKVELIDEDDVQLDSRLKGQWNVMELWNKFLTFQDEAREIEPRDYMWPTDLGKNYFERYLKMSGIKPATKYNNRVLRKFVAGSTFERIVGFTFAIIGILKEDNTKIEIPATENTLRISGKIDYLLGGEPKKWEEIEKDEFAQLYFRFFPFVKAIAKNFYDSYRKNFEGGIKEYIYELKTVNSQVFWAKKEYLQDAYPFHRLQLYTYLKARGIDEGRILYISKDDLTVVEFPVYLNDKELEAEWKKDIEEMSHYYLNKIEPPKPEPIVFNKRGKIKFRCQAELFNLAINYPEFQTQKDIIIGFEDSIDATKDKEEKKRIKAELASYKKVVLDDVFRYLSLRHPEIDRDGGIAIEGCYDKNWEISWSGYIKEIGYKDADEYEDSIKTLISNANDDIKNNFKKKLGLI